MVTWCRMPSGTKPWSGISYDSYEWRSCAGYAEPRLWTGLLHVECQRLATLWVQCSRCSRCAQTNQNFHHGEWTRFLERGWTTRILWHRITRCKVLKTQLSKTEKTCQLEFLSTTALLLFCIKSAMNVSLGAAKWRMPNIKLLGCRTSAMKKTWRSRLYIKTGISVLHAKQIKVKAKLYEGKINKEGSHRIVSNTTGVTNTM